MNVPEELQKAIKEHYDAQDLRIVGDSSKGEEEEVFAYGKMPDSTIEGWFPVGDLDALEAKLRANGEL